MRTVLWHHPDLPATERFVLREGSDEQRLEGTVLTMLAGVPTELRYEVTCDREWHTRWCSVTLLSPSGERTITLVADGEGRWERDGSSDAALDDALDVDLGFSPSTNTLAIRRLELEIGESVRLSVAWLRFPELDLVRAEQVYTRLDERRYRYESGDGDFSAELEVDDRGVVTRYGELWRTIG